MERKQLYATKLLKELRNERGLKQIEMADALGLILERNVSHSTYQKWEQGSKPVILKDAIGIARGLEVRVKDLWRTK